MKRFDKFDDYINNTFAPWVIMVVIGSTVMTFAMQFILILTAYFGI
jgi:hypothetical protein